MARFQTFASHAVKVPGAERVFALRKLMKANGIDAVLVPHADEHQSEYLPERAERLAYVTGFTGSAGAAIIMADKAILFVDGRYTLQAKSEADPEIFAIESLVSEPPTSWLAKQDGPIRLGIDPWLHTIGETKALDQALSAKGGELVLLEENPVDAIWSNQPPPPLGQTRIHSKDHAGRLASDKIEAMQAAVRKAGFDATVLTDPSSIAWMLNIRGSDVPHNPLTLAFMILPAADEPILFVDRRKLDREAHAYLRQMVAIADPEAFAETLAELGKSERRVGLDPALASRGIGDAITKAGGAVDPFDDPARLPRAMKNDVEIEGARTAHRRDGVAMATFLHWLSEQTPGSVTESMAVDKLEKCRIDAALADDSELQDISFDTISGSGPNGAIIHYRVTEESDRPLGDCELYLIDSGGQYVDGTTDITRTIAIGEPTDEMRRHATTVLRGMIALSRVRFPEGCWGSELDPIARQPLWQAGMDYAHGTGHGVGSFLAVHEGPQRIARTGKAPLKAGMILSNEPGYYREGKYGIRMENLIVVEPAAEVGFGNVSMHSFETLTLCPFDRRLIEPELMSSEEIEWLNAYHKRIASEIGPRVSSAVGEWLETACAPL
ncbi:aminopeptidase P family protein [Notoacmeibacter sp. MSK16QG-6]|uniref:aminopeptidase P family protein n=1 Tax=Notoacmeibacter sp. MSK16QG-6 TaxID=2957982 RepID=UPI0020A0E381|nr:aminopeptidase P family protein [Notoacmeibacter sp. MSK16QG-6]MCP1199688.1 aminopeptidase P family protein [Notoacmeibacter sp. MSK16QG-6]